MTHTACSTLTLSRFSQEVGDEEQQTDFRAAGGG